MQDDFEIADGFDGSASSYTITYAALVSDEICGMDTMTIQASACIGLICTHTLKINPFSPCLFSISGVTVSITIFVTNALGRGASSDPVVFVIPECDGPGITYNS